MLCVCVVCLRCFMSDHVGEKVRRILAAGLSIHVFIEITMHGVSYEYIIRHSYSL